MTEKTALTKKSRNGKEIVVTATSIGNILITVDGDEMYNGPNCPTSPGRDTQEKLGLDPTAGVYGPVVLSGPEIKCIREILAEVHPKSKLQELMNQRAALAHAVSDAGNSIPKDLPEVREGEFFQKRQEAIARMNELSKELTDFEAQHPQVVQRVRELKAARLERSSWN